MRKKLNPVSNQPERVYESDSDEEIPFKYNPIVQRVR